MALATSRINHAKILLATPQENLNERMEEAGQLIAAMNYYYLSPVFLSMSGPSLKRQLERKYGIKHRFSCCDFFMNFITVPLTDEFLILSAFIIGAILMCLFWKPAWEQSAYSHGFNYVHNVNHNPWDNIWQPALHGDHNDACIICNQEIDCIINGTLQCSFAWAPDGCPGVAENGVNAVLNASAQQQSVYLDPNSFVNNTYTIYFLAFGSITDGGWIPVFCNRTTEARYQREQAKTYWILSYCGVLVGAAIFYFIMNYLLKCFHNISDAIDPSNYRLIRRDIESVAPAKPITHASETIN